MVWRRARITTFFCQTEWLLVSEVNAIKFDYFVLFSPNFRSEKLRLGSRSEHSSEINYINADDVEVDWMNFDDRAAAAVT